MSGVTVLCPNAKRCFVKVTPGTLLKQVLEEACLKEGFDVAAFQLVNQKRSVDLALPFRLSGLPNNATLEMVPASDASLKSVATIALQVPQGDRLEGQFPVSESLYSVLQSFSPLFEEDLTASRDHLVPSCSYMNRQYVGREELSRITLSSIGITSGKCLIRYQRLLLTEEQKSEIANRLARDAAKKEALLSNFAQKKAENEDRAQLEADRLARFEESLKLEREKKEAEHCHAPTVALEPIPRSDFSPFTRDILRSPPHNQSGWSFDVPVFAAPSETTSVDRLASLNRLLQQVDTSLTNTNYQENNRITDILADQGRVPLSQIAAEVEHMEKDDTSTAVPLATSVSPCDRQSIIFFRESPTETATLESELSEEFFEIGLDDLKARQRQLHDEVRMHTQRMLVPKMYVNKKNREAKLSAYCHTVIRIPVGPERIVQALFKSAEPVSRLYEWVRSLLSRDVPFSLHLVLNENVENTDLKNFVDCDMAPKSTVFLKFKSGIGSECLTCKNVLECTQEEANKLSAEWLSSNSEFVPFASIIAETDRNGKRPASNVHALSSEFVPPPHKAGPAPKWLKR